MSEPKRIEDLPRRFPAKLSKNNRIVIPKFIVEVWAMREGETWQFDVVNRVRFPAKKPKAEEDPE